MYGPIAAALFGELPSPVQWIDDPYPRTVESGRIVAGLFGQHRVVRAQPSEFAGKEILCPLVPGRTKDAGVGVPDSGSDLEQSAPGGGGQLSCHDVIVGGRFQVFDDVGRGIVTRHVRPS
jgi:hypothetical protein